MRASTICRIPETVALDSTVTERLDGEFPGAVPLITATIGSAVATRIAPGRICQRTSSLANMSDQLPAIVLPGPVVALVGSKVVGAAAELNLAPKFATGKVDAGVGSPNQSL